MTDYNHSTGYDYSHDCPAWAETCNQDSLTGPGFTHMGPDVERVGDGFELGHTLFDALDGGVRVEVRLSMTDPECLDAGGLHELIQRLREVAQDLAAAEAGEAL